MTAGSPPEPPGGFVDRGPLGHTDTRVQVLVVDDDAAIRQIVSRLLTEAFDVDVVEADDGAAALDQVLTGSVDLVLLDLSMGVIAGVETLEAIRSSRTYARIPILIMTGQPEEASVRRAIALGVDGVILKPFTPGVFTEQLRPIVAARRAERARVPSHGRGLLALTVSHRVIVMDSDPTFRAIAARHLRALCVIEESENEFAALRQAQMRPPHLIVAGSTSELSSAESFAGHVRRLPKLATVKIVAAVPRSSLGAALGSPLYDGAIVRHFEEQAFEEGLQYAFDADTLAHLLITPSSSLVMDLFDSVASALRRILVKDVTSHPSPPRPQSEPLWVVAWVEFECAQLLWELRLRCPLPLAYELAGRRLHIALDRLTQDQPIEIIATIFTDQLAQFQQGLAVRGLPTTAGVPDVDIHGSEGARVPLDRATGARRWLLTATGDTMVVEVGPGRSISRENG